jgi:hypothetical protein
MRSITIVVICASLGFVVHCDLLKREKEQAAADGATSTAQTGTTAATTTTNAATTAEATADPSQGATSGCAWPEDGSKNVTITKGCSVVAKHDLWVKDGATLTIEEGVKIAFDTDRGFGVDYGKLIVKGTQDQPVTFTSSNSSPAPGDWWGVQFHEKTSSGTSLDHVIIEYTGSKTAGGSGSIQIADMRQGGRISITSSTFRNSSQFGLEAGENATFGKFENNTFKDNKSGSIKVKAEVLGSVGRGNVFNQPIHVEDSTVDQTTSWPPLEVPVLIDGNITIGSDSAVPVLTIADKTVVKVGQDRHFHVGDKPGALVAKNVSFTSNSPSPAEGDWVGVILFKKSNGTDIENCTFEYYGSNTAGGRAAITFWGNASEMRVTLTGNTFRKSKQPGLYSDDHNCGDFVAKNKFDGVPSCNKP